MKENSSTQAKLINKGNTADVFEYGEGKICKLFFTGFPESAINREFLNAVVMQKFSLPVPACYETVHWKNRTGIVYERIQGKTMTENFMENGDTEFLVNTLVDLHHKVINHHTQAVMSCKDFLYLCIHGKDIRDKDLPDKIKKLPDGDHLCHGDFHPGNVLIDPGGKVTIIDFMNVCYGPWQYDVARTYFLTKYGEIPDGFPDKQEIMKLKHLLADIYLEKMRVSFEEISEFVAVISECREYEMQ